MIQNTQDITGTAGAKSEVQSGSQSRGFDPHPFRTLKHGQCHHHVSKLPSTCGPGEKNGHWKGGISKDFYRYKKLQIERYPERVAARETVRKAIRAGKLTRLPCQHPGCTEQNTFAHHTDYSKPLEVTWLCRPHHAEADKCRLNFPQPTP